VIRVVQIGPLPPGAAVERLLPALCDALGVECTLSPWRLDPEFAYEPKRNQFYSTAIVKMLASLPDRMLGITAVDLFVPVLSFVFGEAQLGGKAALVSICRLQQEFYGLPADDTLLVERLLKEAVHELGHTYGLKHCDNWQCAMSSSHAVEKIDMKTAELCPKCRSVVALNRPAMPPATSGI
jgi:archaemetzincin